MHVCEMGQTSLLLLFPSLLLLVSLLLSFGLALVSPEKVYKRNFILSS